MRPSFIDTLARAALSRAGRMPPARDALAGRPGAGPAASPRPAIQFATVQSITVQSTTVNAATIHRATPAEATVAAVREPATLSRVPTSAPSRPSARASAPGRPASVRTPPKMDLVSYLERRRGRP